MHGVEKLEADGYVSSPLHAVPACNEQVPAPRLPVLDSHRVSRIVRSRHLRRWRCCVALAAPSSPCITFDVMWWCDWQRNVTDCDLTPADGHALAHVLPRCAQLEGVGLGGTQRLVVIAASHMRMRAGACDERV